MQVLRERQQRSLYVEQALESVLGSTPLRGVDRALVHELVCGIVRWQATLDWLILRRTDGRPQPDGVQNLLRLGLYQLFWLDRVPDHAAINETVELAKRLGFTPQVGFINAILRGYQREHDAARALLKELEHTQPEIGFSHPRWLCERWRTRFGEADLARLLEWNNTPPITFARRNSLKISAEALLAQWRVEGLVVTPRAVAWAPPETIFEIQSPVPFPALESFRSGAFYIQDPSTLLAVAVLDPQPGEAVLDFCAAPGGKATYIAQRMENRGEIVAQDLDVRRRNLIRENCDRLGVTCVSISRATTIIHETLSKPFDRVLVDAPCSNTGVMRRRVDVRWRVQLTEIERLQGIQLEILTSASLQVKPGGVLVYSTCSLEEEENGELVRHFLQMHPNFHLEHEQALIPFRDAVDGAYVAKLIRDV